MVTIYLWRISSCPPCGTRRGWIFSIQEMRLALKISHNEFLNFFGLEGGLAYEMPHLDAPLMKFQQRKFYLDQ